MIDNGLHYFALFLPWLIAEDISTKPHRVSSILRRRPRDPCGLFCLYFEVPSKISSIGSTFLRVSVATPIYDREGQNGNLLTQNLVLTTRTPS